MAARDLLHYLHHQLILVGSHVYGCEYGRKLVLGGRYFVVLGLGKNAVPPQFFVELLHECRNARLYGAEIVVLKLLSLGRLRPEERSARENQVFALFVHGAVDKEVFLLGAHLGDDALRRRVAEEPQYAQCLPVERLHAFKERRLFVEHLAAVRKERRGNVQGAVLDEGEGGGVPRRVASRFKSGAHPARREGRGVGLAHHELLARKFHYYLSVLGGRNKAVVLFRRYARHGLEPVRKVRGALLHRPVLHRVGDHVGDVHVQRMPEVYGVHKRLVGVFGQPRLHNAAIKYVRCKNFRNVHNICLRAGK